MAPKQNITKAFDVLENDINYKTSSIFSEIVLEVNRTVENMVSFIIQKAELLEGALKRDLVIVKNMVVKEFGNPIQSDIEYTSEFHDNLAPKNSFSRHGEIGNNVTGAMECLSSETKIERNDQTGYNEVELKPIRKGNENSIRLIANENIKLNDANESGSYENDDLMCFQCGKSFAQKHVLAAH